MADKLTDREAQEEQMWEQYCRRLESEMRGSAWVLIAVPADVEAELMQEKARSVVH